MRIPRLWPQSPIAGQRANRLIKPLALSLVLGISSCQSPLPTIGSPAAPTISRGQKPDEPPANKPAIDLVSYTPGAPAARQTAARICATVNGVAILDDELREASYGQLLGSMGLREPDRSHQRKLILAKALEQLVEREVILQEAFDRLKEQPQAIKKLKEFATKEYEKKMRGVRKITGIKSDDEFRLVLATQGVTLAGVQRQEERNVMALEFMKNVIVPRIDSIGREDLENYYRQHPEEFRVPDSVAWQDIFIDASKYPSREAAQQFAESLATRARNGEDFGKLVAEFDQGDSSYRNGEGFGKRRGGIRPVEAEPVLFQMQAGDIGPVIALGSGFHVVKLTSREFEGIKPFNEKTQNEVRNKLQGDIWEMEYKKEIADLKRKSTIEISASAVQ
jgi:parvulin-like peptidyl-prolyl isomerase